MKLKDFFNQRKRRRLLDRVNFATVIGAGSIYNGTFESNGDYLVYGHVEGICDIKGCLMLDSTGCWVGNINAQNVVISGEVIGNVVAEARIELRVGARVQGSIKSPIIAIAEGAVYEGEIRMRPTPQITSFSEKRKQVAA